jgi:hypothetical protein
MMGSVNGEIDIFIEKIMIPCKNKLSIFLDQILILYTPSNSALYWITWSREGASGFTCSWDISGLIPSLTFRRVELETDSEGSSDLQLWRLKWKKMSLGTTKIKEYSFPRKWSSCFFNGEIGKGGPVMTKSSQVKRFPSFDM